MLPDSTVMGAYISLQWSSLSIRNNQGHIVELKYHIWVVHGKRRAVTDRHFKEECSLKMASGKLVASF